MEGAAVATSLPSDAGLYKLRKLGVVRETQALHSKKTRTLLKETIITVLAVVEVPQEDGLRRVGQIADGWITLENVGTGHKWAVKCKDQPNKDRNEEVVQLSIDSTRKIEDFFELVLVASYRDDWRGKLVFEKIGEGTYGSVVRAKKKDTGESVAVKQISKSPTFSGLSPVHGFSPDFLRRMATEIDVMKSLDHPNIIKLYDAFQNNRQVLLVMELALGGELFDRIIEAGHFTESQTAHCMRQIFRAVKHCHSRNICIRSLKPEDVLCMTKDPIDEAVLKLIDFKMSTRFRPGVPLDAPDSVATYYVAPQILAGEYDEKCDLWSCGVLMYVCQCGYPPFYGRTDADVLTEVRLGNYSFNAADWKGVSEDAKNLIRMLLKMNPAVRYTADQALAHPWLAVYAPKVIYTVQKVSSATGGIQIALFTLGASEAARLSYDSSPSFVTLQADAATKMSLYPEQVELLLPDGSQYQE